MSQSAETVGYQVASSGSIGSRTRIQVLTEGILTRRLQSDPDLPGVGLLIFDEFHERSLQADLGLALALDLAAALRPDLRILVMSATLEAEAVARLLGDAPVIRAEGRSFPVTVRYADLAPRDPLAAMEQAVREACGSNPGTCSPSCPGPGRSSGSRGRLARHPERRDRGPAPARLPDGGGAAARTGPGPRPAAGSCSPPTSPRPA